MSPGGPVYELSVQVPRHNSQRIGPALTAEVESSAREQGVKVDVRQLSYESSNALALAIESASEWNSLLITARAERGPQWDCGTQQFLVDAGSELYYDPSPLLESVNHHRPKDVDNQDRNASMQTGEFIAGSPSQRHPNSSQYQFGAPMSPATPPRHANYPGTPYGGGVSLSHFYGDGSSPVKMGYPPDNMGFSPEMRRRPTRGTTEDGFPVFHGN